VFDVRSYVPAAILVVGCAFVWRSHAQDATPLTAPLSGVLATLDGYATEDQTIAQEEQRVAGMTSYVARAFLRDSAVAFTTLVSYYDRQTQGKTIHSPRNCLPGAGWEIVQAGTQTLNAATGARTVNRYVLKNGPHAAVAYYWYQGRGRVTANEYVVKWNLLRDAALLGRSEEALVRIVVPVSKSSLPALHGSETSLPEDVMARRIAVRLIDEVDGVLPPRRARGRSAD
jgi:EpsI family protein